MVDPSPSLSSSMPWTVVVVLCALLPVAVVVAPVLNIYTSAYYAAPREITTFVDAVDGSIQENESYDADVSKVSRLEDKMRLNKLLREIQKQGDDLREDLNRLVVEEGGSRLRASTRFLWAYHRQRLEERVRRIDMLRMRFLVVYMSIVATTTAERPKDPARTAPKVSEKTEATPPPPPPPPALPVDLHKAVSDGLKRKPPLRRLTTQAMGHNEKTEHIHRSGWFGVVAELQRSPILRQRHASIEEAMRSPPPMSPIGSPLAAIRPIRDASTPEPLKI
ncbi:hypothetical protein F5Y17DRAFT_264816 [Xylariaceae sp. FL0594]|nr:hypothetical protein F5Y17DRAFT_264816 [Xylariaceae sp. FL0594]